MRVVVVVSGVQCRFSLFEVTDGDEIEAKVAVVVVVVVVVAEGGGGGGGRSLRFVVSIPSNLR